jgi:hypothetical protein
MVVVSLMNTAYTTGLRLSSASGLLDNRLPIV